MLILWYIVILQYLWSEYNIWGRPFRNIWFLLPTLRIKVAVKNWFLWTHIWKNIFIGIFASFFMVLIIVVISLVNAWDYWRLTSNQTRTIGWVFFIILKQNIVEILKRIRKVKVLLFELFHFSHCPIYFDYFFCKCSLVKFYLLHVLLNQLIL